uniref:Uncharacterized protein n=1 Tax=Solanum tuberosum TaxID=4113 RepID=M1CNY8_SOLTU
MIGKEQNRWCFAGVAFSIDRFHVLFHSSYFSKYITLLIELSFLHPAIKNLRRNLPSLRMNLQCKMWKSRFPTSK